MGTIADKLAYTRRARDEIRQAIVGKGVNCPGSAPFCTFDDYIKRIESGGGDSKYITCSEATITQLVTISTIQAAEVNVIPHSYYMIQSILLLPEEI